MVSMVAIRSHVPRLRTVCDTMPAKSRVLGANWAPNFLAAVWVITETSAPLSIKNCNARAEKSCHGRHLQAVLAFHEHDSFGLPRFDLLSTNIFSMTRSVTECAFGLRCFGSGSRGTSLLRG
jgi:hypothetical protein